MINYSQQTASLKKPRKAEAETFSTPPASFFLVYLFFDQIVLCFGYDSTYSLDHKKSSCVQHVATICKPKLFIYDLCFGLIPFFPSSEIKQF